MLALPQNAFCTIFFVYSTFIWREIVERHAMTSLEDIKKHYLLF